MPPIEDHGAGTREHAWQLTTPSGSSAYTMYRDESVSPPALVCVVGKTELRYQLRCIEDLHAMLKTHGDWMPLGSADEQKPAAPGTVEAWGRAPDNPVGGWYGMKKGLQCGQLAGTSMPSVNSSGRTCSTKPSGAYSFGCQRTP